VRLSGAEMQALRNELGNVSTMLAEALGTAANAAGASASNVSPAA